MRHRYLLIAGIAVAAGLVVPNFPVRSDPIWIDAVTGSTKSQTCWLMFSTPPRIQRSAIEQWVVGHQGSSKSDWRFLTRAQRNVFGQIVARGCALAPEIYPLHAGDDNDRYTRVATDTEIGEFVRVMRAGTASEKEQAVAAAWKKAVEIRD